MADNYWFKLDDGGLILKLKDEVGPLNTWEAESGDCLIMNGGVVDAESDRLICRSATSRYDPIVSLYSASWGSEPGDTGRAEAHLASGCHPQNWELIKKE